MRYNGSMEDRKYKLHGHYPPYSEVARTVEISSYSESRTKILHMDFWINAPETFSICPRYCYCASEKYTYSPLKISFSLRLYAHLRISGNDFHFKIWSSWVHRVRTKLYIEIISNNKFIAIYVHASLSLYATCLKINIVIESLQFSDSLIFVQSIAPGK